MSTITEKGNTHRKPLGRFFDFSLFLVVEELENTVGVKLEIGAVVNPFAQEENRREPRLLVMDTGNVDVAIDEGLNLGMLLMVLAGEIYQTVGGTL